MSYEGKNYHLDGERGIKDYGNLYIKPKTP